MMRGTFCDWLIKQGYEFHPDTVILKADSARELFLGQYPQITWRSFEQLRCIPVFLYMFVEWALFDGAGLGGVQIGKRDVGNNRYWATGFTRFGDDDVRRGQTIDIIFNDKGFMENLALQPVGATLADTNLATALFAIHMLHQKAEVELVDYPRNYRRRELRKNGKEPSPYFRIVALGKPVKKNVGQSVGTGNKIQLPLHTVRGHFRTVQNHPIEWFNGTFWIAAHTRGNDELGKLQAHYKIRLPENDNIAS